MDKESKYKRALNQLKREKDYYLTNNNPKALKIKHEVLESIKNYVQFLEETIFLTTRQLNQQEKKYEDLKKDTQLLVSYCELKGVDPNSIFQLKMVARNELQENLFFLLKKRKPKKTVEHVGQSITYLQIIKAINKGLLENIENYPNTTFANQLKQEILTDCIKINLK